MQQGQLTFICMVIKFDKQNCYQYELIYKGLKLYTNLLGYKTFQISKLVLFEIQMRQILFVAIFKVCIISTVQNLIRYGDFQNIFAYPSGFYVNCSTYCNGIWYTASPFQAIQLLLNSLVPGQTHTTTNVNMACDVYIQLCQDVYVVDIGKIYQYSFDMYCNPDISITSCSVWVILNGQVINGSNHTHTDQLLHHNIGYMNITQQINTICFQSQQFPFAEWLGTNLDNITLQVYIQKTPCNVIGCKFCVLNFPNICQIFQIPEASGTVEGSSSSCQSKFYLNGNICRVCLFPCETCQVYPRNCLSCQNLYRLQENQCVIADEWTLAASVIASMPGIQFFSIGQIFLGISDQFWPYYSHHRAYGNQTIEILTFFHTLQNSKWFLLNLDKKIDFNFQSLNFSDYSRYSNQQFLKMESKTSYFLDGAFEIVFFSFPTMLIVFFVFNRIFYLTFEYRISRNFRPFSFLLMICFLGIREDVSYLSFLSFNNGMNLFSFKFEDKLGHIAWILVFFLLVLFCGGGYFVAKIFYKKLSKYFIDGFFPKLQSFYILSCLSIKAFVIGSVNALFATNYETLIISLVSIEMAFLIGVIYLQWKKRCYTIQTFMFLQMLKSILMTIFNISLWIDWKIRVLQQEYTEQQTKKLLDFNCKALVIVIIGLGVLQAISTYFSGREMLNLKGQKQVSEAKKYKSQTLKIINIKQNAQAKEETVAKQQMRVQQNYLYQINALEKAGKTQNNKIIKIKQPFKKNLNALSIIGQQDSQDEQAFEVIIINGWNDN